MNVAKDKLKLIDINVWKNKLWNDNGQENGNLLRPYRLFESDLNPESFVKINMDRFRRRILANFRNGSLPLNIETCRYTKPKCAANRQNLPITQKTMTNFQKKYEKVKYLKRATLRH